MKFGIDDGRLSPAERRRRERALRKLAPEASRLLEADRLYFERFPHRQHRVRLAAPAELDGLRIASGEALDVPSGQRVFLVVRQIAPGLHAFRYLLYEAAAAAELDVMDEAMAARIWAVVTARAERE